MKHLKKLLKSIKLKVIGIFLTRKIKRIARDMRDINQTMFLAGWDRQRRREYWRNMVTVVKKFD